MGYARAVKSQLVQQALWGGTVVRFNCEKYTGPFLAKVFSVDSARRTPVPLDGSPYDTEVAIPLDILTRRPAPDGSAGNEQ
jgi:hypothetical protein